MNKDAEREQFEYWLADMDDALTRFVETLPDETRKRLNYSPESLSIIEAWILGHYSNTPEMLKSSESRVVDGLARYIGEAFRKAIGGHWDIELDNPKDAYYGVPKLTGFSSKPTPVCPSSLATAAADRRTGTFLRNVIASYIKDKARRLESGDAS